MTGSDDELRWDELLADAADIADQYREDGWDAVVVEPEAVDPVEGDARTGFDVQVSAEAYEVVEGLLEGDLAVTAADVYYRPPEDDADRRTALVVERDDDAETAVFVPLVYDVEAARSVFETALEAEELMIHLVTETDDEVDRWLGFSHDDPSLFLERSDLEGWFESAGSD